MECFTDLHVILMQGAGSSPLYCSSFSIRAAKVSTPSPFEVEFFLVIFFDV